MTGRLPTGPIRYTGITNYPQKSRKQSALTVDAYLSRTAVTSLQAEPQMCISTQARPQPHRVCVSLEAGPQKRGGSANQQSVSLRLSSNPPRQPTVMSPVYREGIQDSLHMVWPDRNYRHQPAQNLRGRLQAEATGYAHSNLYCAKPYCYSPTVVYIEYKEPQHQMYPLPRESF